ncbi:MAG: chloride channel protein, partial [Vicinamibacterales bacterium]
GVLFVVEEVLAAWDAAVLGSIVLAAVSAVVTTRVFLGDAPLFQVPEFSAIADPREALMFVALGAGAGLFAAVYVHGVAFVRRRVSSTSRVPPGVAPLVAGLLAGAVGVWLPEVLGPGYRAMDSALHGQYLWPTLALLGLAKLVTAMAAFGAGVPGGLFAPTLFLGVMLGGTVGALAPAALPFAASPPSTYVLAGMVGVFAGVFRAPMSAIFMGFELSATSAIIVPAMITATLGYLTARQLHRQSILDLVAEDEGAVLPSARTEREAEPMRIEVAMQSSTFILAEGSETAAAVGARVRGGAGSPATPIVIRASGAWCTIDPHALEATTANGSGQLLIGQHPDLRPLAVVHPDEPLDTALRHLARNPVLPVVSRLNQGQLLGVVTLAGIHRAYGLSEMQTIT